MKKNIATSVIGEVSIFFFLALIMICSVRAADQQTDEKKYTIKKVTNSAVIYVINVSGNVTFNGSPATRGTMLNKPGLLEANGTLSWVDLNLPGGGIARLKNGSIELSFYEKFKSNIYSSRLEDSNTRTMTLIAGKILVYIREFEQPRMLHYNFLTDQAYLSLQHGIFSMEAYDGISKITVCKEVVSIFPRILGKDANKPLQRMKVHGGNIIIMKKGGSVKKESIAKDRKDYFLDEFKEIGISNCR